MIEQVFKPKNLYRAHQQVVRNKGAAGVDNMTVYDLSSYLDDNRKQIINSIASGTFVPNAILGVEIPSVMGRNVYWESPQ